MPRDRKFDITPPPEYFIYIQIKLNATNEAKLSTTDEFDIIVEISY